MAGKLFAARLHFNQHAARPDEVGILGFIAGKPDTILKARAFRQHVRVVVEGFEQVEKKSLGLAFFIAFELGGEVGKILKGFFLRGHGEELN
jgi:hypothetical protein